MSLTLTGVLYRRDTRNGNLDNGDPYTSHTATVDMGRGEVIRVKVPNDPAVLAEIPPTHEIPESGLRVAYECTWGYGKLRVSRVVESGLPARKSGPLHAASGS